MRLRADNQADVEFVASALGVVPLSERPYLAAAIINNDLMRGPWWFQLLVGLIRLRGNTLARLLAVYQRFPDFADDLLKQTALHARVGKDREDEGSVGGFSQREMDLIVADLQKLAAR